MPTEYDANILQKCADDLYALAGNIIMSTALKYGLVGLIFSGILFGVIAAVSHDSTNGLGIFLLIVITALAVAVGVSEGRRLALKLKLEAQQLLCQRQIELNTRAVMQGRREPPTS
ncbi:MAG: hypothetical protein ACLQBK_02850 [Candidatus Sulfotelmatobacter sp.]